EAIPDIEEVDLLGSACDIAELVQRRNASASFDYVLSSHNFEHLPDPIRFLQGCEKVLKPGGTVSMAVPDLRTCFDYFRPRSITSALIEAFFKQRQRPTPAQFFTQLSLAAPLATASSPKSVGSSFVPEERLEEAYQQWLRFEQNPADTYRDAHCWAFTPAS